MRTVASARKSFSADGKRTLKRTARHRSIFWIIKYFLMERSLRTRKLGVSPRYGIEEESILKEAKSCRYSKKAPNTKSILNSWTSLRNSESSGRGINKSNWPLCREPGYNFSWFLNNSEYLIPSLDETMPN